MSSERNPQSKTTMIFAVVFLGFLGIHRLMMGYKYWWIQLLTFGGFGIWTLIDLVGIATGRMGMADGSKLVTTGSKIIDEEN